MERIKDEIIMKDYLILLGTYNTLGTGLIFCKISISALWFYD